MPRNLSIVGRWLTVSALALGLGTVGWAGSTAAPAPAKPTPAASAPAAAVIPDYGGRTSGLTSALDAGSGVGTAASPMAQAGRAFEALVVVLAMVVGGMFLLKRSGLLKGDGAGTSGPASWAALLSKRPAGKASAGETERATELLSLLGSQTLPHSPGAGLHLVSVGGRVLLLGATGQSVTLLTEVTEFALPATAEVAAETPEEVAAFADYLARVGVAAPTGVAAEATRVSLSAATDRLQSLLSRGPK